MAVTAQLLFFLVAGVTTFSADGSFAMNCLDMVQECDDELLACFGDPDCIEAIVCVASCDLDDAECIFSCAMSNLENENYLNFMQCAADTG